MGSITDHGPVCTKLETTVMVYTRWLIQQHSQSGVTNVCSVKIHQFDLLQLKCFTVQRQSLRRFSWATRFNSVPYHETFRSSGAWLKCYGNGTQGNAGPQLHCWERFPTSNVPYAGERKGNTWECYQHHCESTLRRIKGQLLIQLVNIFIHLLVVKQRIIFMFYKINADRGPNLNVRLPHIWIYTLTMHWGRTIAIRNCFITCICF